MGKKKKTNPIAAVLVRESRDNQDPDSQLNLCLRDAEKFGYYVPTEYQFCEHITGMDNGEDRESVRQLKECIVNRGDIKAVFCTETTRISRDPYSLITKIKWFNDHNIPVYIDDYDEWTGTILEDGSFEVNKETEDHIFHSATYGKKEWIKIRKRTVRGRKRSARKGLFIGLISDGYKVQTINKEKHIVIDSVDENGNLVGRAALIKRIFDYYTIDHYSTDKISSILNNEKVLTFSALEAQKNVNNKKVKQTIKDKNSSTVTPKSKIIWSGASIGKILKNKWYIGERTITWKCDEDKPITEIYHHDPIISQQQFDEAQERLIINKKIITKRRENTYPLKELFFCGKCGKRMNGHKVRINSSYYCSSIESGNKCGDIGISKQNADAIVWAYIEYIPVLYMSQHKDINELVSVFSLSDVDKEKLDRQNHDLQIEKEQNNEKILKAKKKIAKYKTLIIDAEVEEEEENIQYYNENIISLNKEINDLKTKNSTIEGTINSNNILINTYTSTEHPLMGQYSEITKKKDIVTISNIIHNLIRKVILFNLDLNYKLIQIETNASRKYFALYHANKFKAQYFQLPFTDTDISYNQEQKCFTNNHEVIGWFKYSIGICEKELTKYDLRSFDSNESDQQIQEWENEEIPYLGKTFTIQELVEVLLFHKSVYIRPIVRIEEEPTDEEYLSWKQYYKNWSKEKSMKRSEERKKSRNAHKDEEQQISQIASKLKLRDK